MEQKNEAGFTLIELLVVILVIGILAAIAIPAFMNQRKGERITHTYTAENIDVGYYSHVQIKNHDMTMGTKFQTAGPMVERGATASPFRAD